MTSTPNPADLGELVAWIKSTRHAYRYNPGGILIAGAHLEMIAEALSAQQREIEGLRERHGDACENVRDLRAMLAKAKAEVAALQAKLRDIAEFYSGDDTALGAIKRLAQIRASANAELTQEGGK